MHENSSFKTEIRHGGPTFNNNVVPEARIEFNLNDRLQESRQVGMYEIQSGIYRKRKRRNLRLDRSHRNKRLSFILILMTFGQSSNGSLRDLRFSDRSASARPQIV